MKALSVGLLRGSIDEVDQKVQMTWVQPRVLDLPQVTHTQLMFWSHLTSPVFTSFPLQRKHSSVAMTSFFLNHLHSRVSQLTLLYS